jgi:hypothetical protein
MNAKDSLQDTPDQDKTLDYTLDEIQKAYRINHRLATTENLISREKARTILKSLLVEAHLNERIEAYDEIYNLHMSQEWDTNSEDLSRFLQRYLHNTLVFKTRLAQLKSKGGDI